MRGNIISLISSPCGCSQTEAREYLDSEIRYLCELQEADDLREDDMETACLNLGLDLDYREYFINWPQGHKTHGYDLFSEHTLSGGLEERIPPAGIGAPPGQGWRHCDHATGEHRVWKAFEAWKDKTGYSRDFNRI